MFVPLLQHKFSIPLMSTTSLIRIKHFNIFPKLLRRSVLKIQACLTYKYFNHWYLLTLTNPIPVIQIITTEDYIYLLYSMAYLILMDSGSIGQLSVVRQVCIFYSISNLFRMIELLTFSIRLYLITKLSVEVVSSLSLYTCLG